MSYIVNNQFSILFSLLIFILSSCSSEDDNSSIRITTEDFSISMDENPANAQSIGFVQGNTNEGNVTFSITQQNPSGAFAIDSASGELTVADASLFKFDINPVITGNVKVSNGNIFENSRVTITLNEDVIEDKVFEGSIFLQNQQQVIDFGLLRYTDITGDLIIGGNDSSSLSNITDLAPLYTLKSIGGKLFIGFTDELITTAGLENLTNIGASLIFSGNHSLEWIEGMIQITSIPGSLGLINNLKLSHLEGLSQVSAIGEGLYIDYNPEITDLDWLRNLVSIDGTLSITNNEKITNIDGLSNLNTLGNKFITIIRNDSLENLDGLENVTDTVTHFSIGENPSLLNINGLNNITPTRLVSITENPLITNLNGLSGVNELVYISINYNSGLISLEGLNNLHSVGGSMTIISNSKLTNIDALSELIHVGEDLQINTNVILKDFCSLTNLVVNGDIGFYNIRNNAYNPTEQNIIDGHCSI